MGHALEKTKPPTYDVGLEQNPYWDVEKALQTFSYPLKSLQRLDEENDNCVVGLELELVDGVETAVIIDDGLRVVDVVVTLVCNGNTWVAKLYRPSFPYGK